MITITTGMRSRTATPCPFPVDRVVIVEHNKLVAGILDETARETFPRAQHELYDWGGRALVALRNEPASLLICGLTLHDIDGLDIIAAARQEKLARRVFVVTERSDEWTLDTLHALRVEGYFNYAAEPVSDLGSIMTQVAAGRPHLARPRENGGARGPSVGELLSRTELEVFAVLGEGQDDERAALRLGMSPNTVKTHRQNLREKLEVHSSSHLVREAIRRGIIRVGSAGKLHHPGQERALSERAARGEAPVFQ